MSERISGSREIRRLLVVEDHRDTREMVVEYFDALGFHVETAVDGNEAIAKALKTSPDIIILEFELPHLDGWDTMRILATYSVTKDIPIVGCTVTGDEGIRRARTLGCRDIARKPCSLAKVEAMVRDVLDAATGTKASDGG